MPTKVAAFIGTIPKRSVRLQSYDKEFNREPKRLGFYSRTPSTEAPATKPEKRRSPWIRQSHISRGANRYLSVLACYVMQGGPRAGSTGFSLAQQLVLINKHTARHENRWRLPTLKTYRREATKAGFVSTEHRGRKKRTSTARGRRYTVVHIPDTDMGALSPQKKENTGDKGAFSTLVRFADFLARKLQPSRLVFQPSCAVFQPSSTRHKEEPCRDVLETKRERQRELAYLREQPSKATEPSLSEGREAKKQKRREERTRAKPNPVPSSGNSPRPPEAPAIAAALVSEFNRLSRAHDNSRRERVTPELERTVAASGETLEQLLDVVVGLFGENAGHRDQSQRLWFLKQGYGIGNAIKKFDTRERLRAHAAAYLELERADAEAGEADRKTECAEEHEGTHTPRALEAGDDGRFECAHRCGFSISAALRAYGLEQDEAHRAKVEAEAARSRC